MRIIFYCSTRQLPVQYHLHIPEPHIVLLDHVNQFEVLMPYLLTLLSITPYRYRFHLAKLYKPIILFDKNYTTRKHP